MSATELYPTKCTFQQCTDYVDISRRSTARGRQTKEGWAKSAAFYLQAWISPKR